MFGFSEGPIFGQNDMFLPILCPKANVKQRAMFEVRQHLTPYARQFTPWSRNVIHRRKYSRI